MKKYQFGVSILSCVEAERLNVHSCGLHSQDSIQAMQSVFNAHVNLPQTRELLVPHEVIDYVDQGRNPDIYTKELLDRVSGENMYTNGIIDAVSVSASLYGSG